MGKSQEKPFEYSIQNERQEEIFKYSKQNKNQENYYSTILGTKWVLPMSSTSGRIVFDSLVFKPDCTAVHYSCELESKSFGKFYLKRDTVIIKSDSSNYSDYKSYKHILKLLLVNDTLMPVYAKFGRQEPKTKFDSTYIFYKDTNVVLEEGNESNEKQ